jgi:hypothetical protein
MSQAGENDVVGGHPEIPTSFVADAGTAIPILNTLEILGAGGITTSASGNTITITGIGGFTWHNISASQTLVVDEGYFCVSPGGALSLALPATSIVGDMIEVVLDGATSFTITQSAGQQIRLGNLSTTAGVGGSLASTQQGDSIQMVCQTANLKWVVISSMGNPTIT